MFAGIRLVVFLIVQLDQARGGVMLSRRKFSACAICAVAGFAATAVGEAQAQTPGLKRTIIEQMDFPDNFVTLTAVVEVEPGANIARHTHPGVETAYVLEGEADFFVHGQPPRKIKAGDSYQVLREVPHSARNGDKPAKLVITYVVDKGKPLASPAPE